MRTPTVLLLVTALLGTATILHAQGLEWSLVNWKVRHDFPGVPRIDSSQLDQWLRDPHRERPILLDVRTKAEFDVSHIHGAQRLEPGSDAATVTAPKRKPIVTYCSVGYRSAALAKKLQEAGFTNVQNMTGSIFDWANQGYPVEQNGRPAQKVHPYNTGWGKLLKKELRADLPAAGSGM